MKKLLIIGLLGNLNLLAGPATAMSPKDEELSALVKQRSLELGLVAADVRIESCVLEVTINRVMDQAERTRLFIQDLEYCQTQNGGKKTRAAINPDVKKINQNIVPAIMKENRSSDQIERALERMSKQYDKDVLELRKIMEEPFNQKAFLKVGKSFRAGIDEAKKLYSQTLDVFVRLANLRNTIFDLETKYFNRQNSKPVQELAGPELPAAEVSVLDWVASMLGGKVESGTVDGKTVAPATPQAAEKQKQLREEYEAIKAQRQGLAGAASKAAVALNKKPNPNLNGIDSLEEQIKQLSASIESLNNNIDLQLKDLENITKNMTNSTLQKISF